MMRLEVTWKCDQEPQHARIENTDLDTNYNGHNWSDAYVCISGYFGNHDPSMFSAAPDLYEALDGALNAIDASGIGGADALTTEWFAKARSALAKARGEQ